MRRFIVDMLILSKNTAKCNNGQYHTDFQPYIVEMYRGDDKSIYSLVQNLLSQFPKQYKPGKNTQRAGIGINGEWYEPISQ